MKLRACACLCVMLCSAVTFAAPVYWAGHETAPRFTRLLHGEISAGYTFTSGYLQDYTGQLSSGRLHGFTGRALWAPLPWLAVGAEYARMHPVSAPRMVVDALRVSHMGAVVKWTLSPDTNPRLYVLGGYGRSTQRLEFTAGLTNSRYTQSYWLAGLGVEADIYRRVFIAAEGTLRWNPTQYIHKYYKLSSHAQGAVSLRAGVRF